MCLKWLWWPGLMPYTEIVTSMRRHVHRMRTDSPSACEVVWGLEHESVYTAGTSAQDCDLIDPKFPVVPTQRGGRYTYHGPGQLVVYPILDLRKRMLDVRTYVRRLEKWMQRILARCGVEAQPHPQHIGLWVKSSKIGSVGVRVSQGVAWHGFALNVSVCLEHFTGIVPCGLSAPVTSLKELGWLGSMRDVWHFTRQDFYDIF